MYNCTIPQPCPIVYHELLRGARNPGPIYEIRDRTVALAPPTFAMWERAALVLREYVMQFGAPGSLPRLQNDVLIALTMRGCGGLVITADRYFDRLASLIPCQVYVYSAERTA
ncbi:MAG: hypothetical protein HY543_09290 [Deltaproteobacteria bacterium]|nr:hypothetical protein [Deltaproteobacteria bacterium]